MADARKGGMASSQVAFVGPRALFDPAFVPPKVWGKQREIEGLRGLFRDAVEGQYQTSAVVCGPLGAGKTLTVTCALREVPGVETLHVDCEEKAPLKILFGLISALGELVGAPLTLEQALRIDLEAAWNLLGLLLKKVVQPLVVFLDTSEFIDPSFLRHLIRVTRGHHCVSIVCALNARREALHGALAELGAESTTLLEGSRATAMRGLTGDRVRLAFRRPDAVPVEYISDLASEYGDGLPGAAVRLLRQLYPHSTGVGDVHIEQVRELCQHEFEGYQLEAFTVANWLIDADVLGRLYLDNIVTAFKEESYLPFRGLQEQFGLACEALEYDVDLEEFHTLTRDLVSIDVLRPSRYSLEQGAAKRGGLYVAPYFLAMPAFELGELVAACFAHTGF
jgi:hypothetical protein